MYKFIFLLLLIGGLIKPVDAGNNRTQKASEEKPTGFALSGHTSTNGFGGAVIYKINQRILVRGGYENLQFNYNFDFNENEITYDASLNYKTGSINILADYYPLKRFYLTGGFGYHLMNSTLKGLAISDWNYGDIQIPPEDIGDFRFRVKPAFRLSPYAGIGFGRNFGLKNRIALSFELGSYYLGRQEVDIEATGLLSPTANPAHGQKELFENQLDKYRFYPVMKLGLSVRLF